MTLAVMSKYMGSNNDKAFKRDSGRKAELWFNRTDDKVPFDAFGSTEAKNRIGDEIFGRINKEIRHIRIVKLISFTVAAAVLLIVSIDLVISRDTYSVPFKANSFAGKAFSADNGKIKIIVLSDSSKVILRPGAKLTVPPSFGLHNRVVELSRGEAYFKVTHDRQHPFIVQSGSITTKVLGTAFTISNTAGFKATEVAVAEGKVQVSNHGLMLALLDKGKRIRYDRISGKFSVDHINVDYVAAWNKASVDLNNATFKELQDVFSSFYGLELAAEGLNVEQLRYTITMDRKAGAKSTLKIIAKIHGLYFKEKNGKIILHE
jgi:transmembrane sensor